MDKLILLSWQKTASWVIMAQTRTQTHTLYTRPHASQISSVTQQGNHPEGMMIQFL